MDRSRDMVERRREMVVEDDDGGGGGVKWDRFLPKESMSVLLVESDNSTRQIISALLRKCSYRVSATSDGLKAWETLKENPHDIDLVLAEVELPSISGFTLLTMIMDHEACKNIPVIMMSSHDSISMVFKCMLKGAADFLVKPLRKNELTNLWQHVWRRKISSGRLSSSHEHLDENLEKKILDDHLKDNGVSAYENKECSKGSDAQSSCTRSEMEDESTYPQNILDIKQQKGRDISAMDYSVAKGGEHYILSDNGSIMHEGETEDKPMMMDTVVTNSKGGRESNQPTDEGARTCIIMEATTADKPSKEAIDLIGGIDTQFYVKRSTDAASDASDIHVHEKDLRCKSSSMPDLELSLRRYQQSYSKTQSDELNMLNHSNSSAFSLYNNRMLVPSLTPATSENESKEYFATSKELADQGSGNDSNSPLCSGLNPDTNREDTDFLGLELTSPGTAVQWPRLRVTRLPGPSREMTLDNLSAGYGTGMQAAQPSWSTAPSLWPEAVNANSSHQSSLNDINYVQSDYQDYHRQAHKQEENKELVFEQRDVSSVVGESGNNSTSIVSRSHLKISGSGNFCDRIKGENTRAYNPDLKPDNGNAESWFPCEDSKPTDCHTLNPRELALNKFRLKRKERCYEKKVRYQSRKRLAEQRPRVKGQFVRQLQSESQSMEAVCSHGDSGTG